jgi:hypothetical protein
VPQSVRRKVLANKPPKGIRAARSTTARLRAGRYNLGRGMTRWHGSQAASSSASNPVSSSIGRGGHPRMCRSIGITFSTAPTTA